MIRRSTIAAGIVLLAILGFLAWTHGGAQKPDFDSLLTDLRAKRPWYYSLAERKYIRTYAPKKWLSRADRSELDVELGRGAAVRKLSALGTNAWPAIPALLRMLGDSNLSTGWAAAIALAGMKAEEHPDWDRMANVLHGDKAAAKAFQLMAVGTDWLVSPGQRFDFPHRRFALVGLGATRSGASAYALDVIAILKSQDEVHELRASAVTALPRIASPTNNFVPLLQTVLSDTQE
jgi:hypothetical protein